jgi:ADP-ribose pyrophosphatase YjhB (NUDIX family)
MIDEAGRAGRVTPVRNTRRISAYGWCRQDGRVLLTRGSAGSPFPGVWRLPGGEVRHAEDPERTVHREVADRTGHTVEVTGVRAALADVVRLGSEARHTDRVVFEVTLDPVPRRQPAGAGPDPRRRTDDGPDPRRPAGAGPGAADGAFAWFTAAEAAEVPLLPFTAELLGLPATALPPADPAAAPAPPPVPDRGQRFAAYGLATDLTGRILLTRIAPGYPGAGRWHLPGGGTDHGEQPAAALLRELVEETGQRGRVAELLAVDTLHNPAAMGPEGRPMDWHSVRVVYRVVVPDPSPAVVTEAAGGSTAAAAWVSPERLAELSLTEVAARLTGRSGA